MIYVKELSLLFNVKYTRTETLDIFPQFLHLADIQTETNATESVVEVHLPVVRVTVDKKATTTFTAESSRCRPIDSNEDGNGIKKQTCEIDKLI